MGIYAVVTLTLALSRLGRGDSLLGRTLADGALGAGDARAARVYGERCARGPR